MITSVILILAAPTELEKTIARYVEIGSIYGLSFRSNKTVAKELAQKFLWKASPDFGMKDKGQRPYTMSNGVKGKTDYWVAVADLNRAGESIFGLKNLFAEDHAGNFSTGKTKSGPTVVRSSWEVNGGKVTATFQLHMNPEFGGFPGCECPDRSVFGATCQHSGMGSVSIVTSTKLPAPRIYSFALRKKGDRWSRHSGTVGE